MLGFVTEDRTDVGEFTVELPVFSGPFRLLAELLLEHRIDVCDVPVAQVTDAFLAHASDAQRWDLEEATWFVAVGATLLELKVGRLMPKATEPSEEDLLGGSPDLAYARSLELAAFRRVAVNLAERFEDNARYFRREAGPPEEFAHLYPDIMEQVTADALARVAAVALRPPPLVDLSHVQPVRATVAEALETMRDRMASLRTARFRELVADCEERIHVVVRFLALLEMYREGHVDLSQAGTFGEIEVRLTELPGGAA
jgi:segregation and condensation protein A